jgi:hypothetical protein
VGAAAPAAGDPPRDPAGAAPCERAPATLEAARRRSRTLSYAPPSAANIEKAEKLFALLLAPAPRGSPAAGDAPARAGELGFELHELGEGQESFLLLIEPEATERGWGLYAFRAGGGPLAIEAPHSFEDLYTGAIASRLFLEGRAAAVAFSTAPRNAAGDTGEGGDLAHLADGIFHAFTRAFAAAHPRGIVLQVHGFDGEGRQVAGRALPEAIFSNGTRSPPAWLLRAAECLDAAWPETIAVYPRGVSELGGTTNAQGRTLRALRHSGFLHLEMGLGLRRRLKDEPELRKEFLRCIPETCE